MFLLRVICKKRIAINSDPSTHEDAASTSRGIHRPSSHVTRNLHYRINTMGISTEEGSTQRGKARSESKQSSTTTVGATSRPVEASQPSLLCNQLPHHEHQHHDGLNPICRNTSKDTSCTSSHPCNTPLSYPSTLQEH